MIVNICDIFVMLIIVYMDCSILLCAQIKLLLLLWVRNFSFWFLIYIYTQGNFNILQWIVVNATCIYLSIVLLFVYVFDSMQNSGVAFVRHEDYIVKIF